MSPPMDMADGFRRFRDDFEGRARRGLAQAGMALLQDCVMDMPAVPLDEGTLRGSGSVHVSGEFKFDSSAMASAGNPTPNRSPIPNRDTANLIESTVGFNTPYAAYQHEGERADGTHKVENYSHSGTGAKFLEQKMSTKRNRYMGIVAKNMRGGG